MQIAKDIAVFPDNEPFVFQLILQLVAKRYLSPPYISSVFIMASTWRYTLVCLDGVIDISTTD